MQPFQTTIIEAERPRFLGLFAVGRGGNPLRHLPLLQALARHECTIVAPHFDMLGSMVPTKAELDDRIGRLAVVAGGQDRSDLPLVGIGHSIGTVCLLVLAGGRAETRGGEGVLADATLPFARLALLAPAADFFRRPGALRDVTVPVRLWAGRMDVVTPPDQALYLKEALEERNDVDLVMDERAGHFTYMDELPPHISDPHPDRGAFLASLADDVAHFLVP